MKELFVTYAIAKALQEKDFYQSCFFANYFVFGDGKVRDSKYGQTEPELFICGRNSLESREEKLQMHAYHDVSVPTHQQVIDWLRVKHNIEIVISPITLNTGRAYYVVLYYDVDGTMTDHPIYNWVGNETMGYKTFTYLKAMEVAIEEAIKLI